GEGRRLRVDKDCPLPTAEDRLFFILTYLKTSALQGVQGRLFGMGQSTAHQWMHVLLPALLAALRALGDAPTRSLTALVWRFGVSEAEAASVVAPLEEPVPVTTGPAAAPVSPLVPLTARNGGTGRVCERPEKGPYGTKSPVGQGAAPHPLPPRDGWRPPP